MKYINLSREKRNLRQYLSWVAIPKKPLHQNNNIFTKDRLQQIKNIKKPRPGMKEHREQMSEVYLLCARSVRSVSKGVPLSKHYPCLLRGIDIYGDKRR